MAEGAPPDLICVSAAVILPSDELCGFAEDPDFYLEPPDGAERIADSRFHLVIGPERRWAGLCRLRLPRETAPFDDAVSEILFLVEGIESAVWNIGPAAAPAGVVDRLRARGLRDPDPPLEPVVAALVLDKEPDAATGVAIRRIETLADHLIGLEIVLASATWPAVAAAAERARAEETFERRTRRGGLQWLASVDGAPAAFAMADRGRAGLYLSGGATLPEARGRGCYRALVRARWDEAVRLGTPGLAVQAQYGSSAPILRRLGFVEVAAIHTLQS